ncbi:RDD family protein [Streptomyces sp. NPDC092903]|uniref:RDD family protein n=1 Tax=Streptomyces sp. NPDC092903 TaxID=3366017 RepID=UPI0037FB43DE
MSYGDPHNPYARQPPHGLPGHPQAGPQGTPRDVPPPYGVPPRYGYQQQPYGMYPPAWMPGVPGPGLPPPAHWGERVGAWMLDLMVIVAPMYALGFVDIVRSDDPANADPGPFFAVGVAYFLVMGFYQLYREGRYGQTTGKKVLRISVRRQADGRTLGFGMAFVRKLAHIVDSLPCYLGWLWPLWDVRRQTFADKMCSTVVIKVAKG